MHLHLDGGESFDHWNTTPQYVALGQLLSRQRDIPTGIDRFSSIDFIFGQPSQASAVPRSGSAGYELRFKGSRSSGTSDTLLHMTGGGVALVNFSTGKIEISGKTSSQNYTPQHPAYALVVSEVAGQVRASGSITSGENKFTGTFTAQGGASDTYKGDFTGSFFGPNAQDIGGTLYGTSGPLFYSLAFVGFVQSKTSSEDTLANVEGWTRFKTVGTFIDLPARHDWRDPLGEKIMYDAATQTYRIYPVGVAYTSQYLHELGPANRVPAQDAGDLRAYGVALPILDGKVQYSIGVFDGETAGIELTYTSFMRIFGTNTELNCKVTAQGVDYIGFGIAGRPNAPERQRHLFRPPFRRHS
jgi:hypothetical protein